MTDRQTVTTDDYAKLKVELVFLKSLILDVFEDLEKTDQVSNSYISKRLDQFDAITKT